MFIRITMRRRILHQIVVLLFLFSAAYAVAPDLLIQRHQRFACYSRHERCLGNDECCSRSCLKVFIFLGICTGVCRAWTMPAARKKTSTAAVRGQGKSLATGTSTSRGVTSTAASVRSGVATERGLRDTFNQLSKGRSGYISLNLIGQALRMNNQCPTEADIKKIIEDYTTEETIDEADGEAKVDYEDFCDIMRDNWKNRDQLLEEITAACNTIDKGETGVLTTEELKLRLTSLGEVLDEADVAEMVKDANAVDGKVSHGNLTKLLLDAYSTPSTKKSGKKGAASAKSSGTHKSSSRK